MTTTPSPQTTEIDPRPALAEALRVADDVIRAVQPNQLADRTPCTDYDVRALLRHLVGAVAHLAAVGRGEDSPTGGEPPPLADDAWPGAWAEAAASVESAWSDTAMLGQTFDLGWATMTGADALAIYASEVILHTWDLAQATGQHPTWDPGVVRVAFDALRGALPAEGRAQSFDEARKNAPAEWGDFPDPFAPAVELPADAPLVDQLVAWSGRQP